MNSELLHSGDLHYLEEQKNYLVALLKQLATKIDSTNNEPLDGTRFLDWPSSENLKAVHAGLQPLPHLDNLSFVSGTFPTPYGVVKIRPIKKANGKIISTVQAPKEITVIRNEH